MSPSLNPTTVLAPILRSPWLHPLNDAEAIDDILESFGSIWSLRRIRARVVAGIRETPDTRTLVLRPNRLWPGHRAGQHLVVEVEIDGRRVKRSFSISSAPRSDGLLAITAKKRRGGRVSVWWNEDAVVGDTITLHEPSGDFVLPEALPPRMTMIACGSGITPIMAMIRELASRHPGELAGRSVTLCYVVRSRRDAIFLAELEALRASNPWLTLELHLTEKDGRIDGRRLAELARDAGESPAWLCGPEAFMELVRGTWRAAGLEEQLRFERFGPPPVVVRSGEAQPVLAGSSKVSFEARPGETLLAAAERAGLRPTHGCRIGVCHTCKCRKLSGSVEDIRDGRVSDDGDETIQLCISTARTPVTLEL